MSTTAWKLSPSLSPHSQRNNKEEQTRTPLSLSRAHTHTAFIHATLFQDLLVNLKDCYDRIGNELRDLESIEKRESWQEEDMQHAIVNRKALKEVLSYFMTHLEAKEYFNGEEND
jgi:hypothetical protein